MEIIHYNGVDYAYFDWYWRLPFMSMNITSSYLATTNADLQVMRGELLSVYSDIVSVPLKIHRGFGTHYFIAKQEGVYFTTLSYNSAHPNGNVELREAQRVTDAVERIRKLNALISE